MLSISRSIFWIWQRSLTEPDKSASKKINSSFLSWWAHLGSNQGPTGYEPVALPAELWAPSFFYYYSPSPVRVNSTPCSAKSNEGCCEAHPTTRLREEKSRIPNSAWAELG